ncbi:MAG TPA: GvpL/GvpF family gas vesicle protein [Gemmatimonadaceae bacterium]|nr:GvpL/GvpF family gas vesicle protein [Gemmatimonadaceae bacterium]
MTDHSLVYLYGVVPAGAPPPPPGLAGLDDGGVRLLPVGDVAAVVSDVDGATYAEDVLDERLRDLAWVGERGLAHERVATWFADRGPIIPFTLFSLHRSEARLRERLAERAPQLRERLERLAGRREWGIKLWRDEARFARQVAGLSAPLQALEAEMATAAPGRRYLLRKKQDALRADESRRVAAEIVRTVYATLAGEAEAARALPLPPAAASGAERVLVLHAAFLVSEAGFAAFQQRVQALEAAHREAGFTWEFTGPWPPYHFAHD